MSGLYVKTRRATRRYVARHRVPGRYVGRVTVPCDPWASTDDGLNTDARVILGTL